MNKLYRITQGDVSGYDTYDSAVVCATTEEDARNMYPGQASQNNGNDWTLDPSKVNVTYLGKADNSLKTGVICASFNAG